MVTAATVVDHIDAHHRDHEKFWDTGNWQSLCKHHHDSTKQRQERVGLRGDGDQKVPVRHRGTGGQVKLLRPRNWTGGPND
jgi:hypothetical protein